VRLASKHFSTASIQVVFRQAPNKLSSYFTIYIKQIQARFKIQDLPIADFGLKRLHILDLGLRMLDWKDRSLMECWSIGVRSNFWF